VPRSVPSSRQLSQDTEPFNSLHQNLGENFTVEGLPDAEVCIGDRYRIGTALFEVSQPRVTCYRLGIRLGEPQMAALLVAHHRPGFYFRVLEEGEVGAGDEIVKVTKGSEGMSVAEIDGLLYLPNHPSQQLERALRIRAFEPRMAGFISNDPAEPEKRNLRKREARPHITEPAAGMARIPTVKSLWYESGERLA
jgi:MOSC domain-containing protein YiiM